VFYDEDRVAVLGMGFCYPGRDAKGGDLPPRRECAPLWHPRLRPHFAAAELSLLVGSYAIDRYLGRQPMGAAIARWREFLPDYFVLPHPSWRTVLWERANPWFAAELLPELRAQVAAALTPPARSAPCPRR
jgi:uracil-DNA glycosylase